MPFLPVVEREVRVAARRRATYRIRFYAVLLMLGILAWNIWTKSNLDPRYLGEEIFGMLALWAFIYAALVGVLTTSDCISEERREGTLRFLFLTDLKGYDVILGKLAGRSLNAFYGLVAILPIVGIPILIGGVTLLQFGKVSFALISTVVLSLAVGVCVSAHNQNGRKAIFYTVLVLVALVCGPFLLMFWLAEANDYLSFSEIWTCLLFSPGFSVMFPSTPRGTPWPDVSYWYSISWIWLLSVLFLARASAKVVQSPNEIPKPSRARSFRLPRGKTPRQLLDRNPFLWLALRGETHPAAVLVFTLMMILIWFIAWLRFGVFMRDTYVIFPLMVFVHVFLKFWIVTEASRRFNEDRHTSGFELILSTPLHENQIVKGQALALWKQFGPSILLLLACEFVVLLFASNSRQLDQHLAAMFFLPADAVALACAGMWLGLKSKNRGRAVALGLGQVLVIPYLVARLLLLPVANAPDWEFTTSTFVGFFCCAVADLIVCIQSLAKLEFHFRRLATERFTPGKE
jgi:ABC-type transport system involved in cytochrome c biogenesis permease component